MKESSNSPEDRLTPKPGKVGRFILLGLMILTLSGGLFLMLNLRERDNLPRLSSTQADSFTQPGIEAATTLTPAQLTDPNRPPSAAGDLATLQPGDLLPMQAFATPQPWDGKGRVTILVMGLDYADWENTDRVGPPRSDTMIVFTVDPVNQTAGMLSIPRDLWVSMPGIQGEQKINTAYRFGELYEMPGGGAGLALRTVEDLLGVPINYYAVVDFYAFEDFIDELGGIEVDVPAEIKVDPIGPGNTVVLAPGLQLLDGPTALAYARNRSTQGDETDRVSRQQQVILAIRERVLSLEMLPTLITQAPALYAQLEEGLRTNLPLEYALRLAWLAKDISMEDIHRAAIGNSEVIYDTAPDGEQIFVPIPERIQALVADFFVTGSLPGMTTADLVLAEAARVTLVNQTGDETLGTLTAEYLKDQGINVIELVQSADTRPKTRLVDHVDNPYTLRALINLLEVAPSEIYITIDPSAGTDLSVYLGQDWASKGLFK